MTTKATWAFNVEKVLQPVMKSTKTVSTACTEEQDTLSSPTRNPTFVVAMRTQSGEDNANNQQRQRCIRTPLCPLPVTTQHVLSLDEERGDSREQHGSGETLSPSWLRDVLSMNWTTGPPNPRNHTAPPATPSPVSGPLNKIQRCVFWLLLELKFAFVAAANLSDKVSRAKGHHSSCLRRVPKPVSIPQTMAAIDPREQLDRQ